MDEHEKVEELIYYHNGEGDFWFLGRWMKFTASLLLSVANGALAAIVLIVILSFFMENQILVFPISWILFSILIFYLMLKSDRKSKTSYKIYNNRIEFFNENHTLEKDIIDLGEIDQVRYEDDFGKNYKGPSQSWIYCYFKNGYKSKSINIKKDRLKLQIGRDRETENRVIKILQFFQKKKKQVYISTRSNKIQAALNLKNWTDPGIHPSIKI
jgi:hypothetical protein